MSLGTWILDELNKGKKYFGIGQAGLGQFGSNVKNIANTTENRISAGIDKYKNWENALRTKAYGNETARAIENIPKLGAKSVIAPMVQGTARSFASLIPAVTNKPIQVNNTLRKALFGSQYQDIQKPTFEGVRNLQDLGFKEGTAKKYGPAFGVAMTALDVIPGMGGKDDLVKGLAKATTKSGVKKLLPKIADDVAETIAKTTDVNAIRNLIEPKKGLDALRGEARKYKSAEDFANKAPSKVIDEMRNKGIRGAEQRMAFWEKATKGMDKTPVIDSLNPTGGLLVDYTPQARMTAKLADNITTLDKTMGKSPDEMITIYRGAPKNQKSIVGGDFVTTNYDLAKSYTGDGNVLSKKVKLSDVLDDISEPLGEEYLYRPKSQLTDIWNKSQSPTPKTSKIPLKDDAKIPIKVDALKNEARKGDYHILVNKEGGGSEFVKVEGAKPVPNNAGLDLFVSKNKDGLWVVSEAKSGKALTSTMTTRQAAIDRVDSTLQIAKERGYDVKKTIDESIAQHGLSPKYTSTTPKVQSAPNSMPESDVIKQATEARKAQLQKDGFVDPVTDSLSPQSTPGAKLKTKPLVQSPVSEVKPLKTVPSTSETTPIKTKMATVEQAISHPDKVAKATAVGVDPSFEKIVAKTPATVKEKVNILDYIRTPDRVMKKIGLGKETEVLRKSYDKYLDEIPKEIDKIKVWANQSTPQENQNIFRYLDGQKVSLSAKEQKIASEVQSYLKDWADKLKLPQDKRISNYITHIFEKDFIGKEFPEDIAKIIQDRVPGSVYDPFTEQRLGKLGYVEDTWRALDAYVKRATRKYNLDPVLGNISKKADALEQSQYKYVKNYLDRINMRPTEVDNLVDNFIKSTPIGYKLGQRPTTALTRTGRQMVYRGTLGLNVSSALKNLSQGANTYAKLGEKYTAKGYFDLAKNWRSDELQRVGILRDNFIQDKQIGVYKQALEKVDKGLFSLFEGAEKVNRGAAYYGAKAKALAQGKTEQEAIDFAKKIVRDTQFTFGSIDTPVAMQSDLVKLATQFQSFTVKQGEFLGEMVASKDIAGLARWLGASLLFVYGVGELFGMEPKDLIPTVRIGTPPVIQGAVQGTKYLLKSPNKYGQPTSLKDVGNAFLPFVPAGVQLKKTIEGLGAANRGYSQTSSGNVRYPVEQNITNKIRGGLFGQYNFNEAKEYFNKGRSALSEQQSEIFKLGGGAGYYGKVMGDRESSKQAEEEMKALKSNKKTTAQDLGEGVYQLSNGKFYVQSLDKSFSDVKDADIAVKGDSFLKSGKKELITDDYVFEKADTDKGYKATPRIDYEIDVRDGTYGTLATLKKNKDIEGWMKEAETLVALYDAKLQDPDITSKEKRELEGKKRSLEDSMSKYASYGGFTKGSSKSKKIKLNTSGITTTKLSATKPSAPSAGTMPSKYAKLQVKKGNPNVKFTSLRGAATGTKKKGARILRGKKYGA